MSSKDSSQSTDAERRLTHGRLQRPLDETSIAHTIVRVLEEADYSIADPGAFLRRVQHVEYGLSAEIEFAALLRWLGSCPFVHRLSEDALSDGTNSNWLVPDLLAVFQNGDQTCSVTIEVKTTASHTLRLKTDYVERLQAYADLITQPLLLAWRPRNIGFWMLFEPYRVGRLENNTLVFDLENVMQNDLMSMVAGDFFITPKQGAGLVLETSRISEKQPTEDDYKAVFQVKKAYMRDGDGGTIENVPNAIFWILLSAMEEQLNVSDEGFVLKFAASGGMTRAQLILRTAASFLLNDEQRIHWKSLGANLDTVISSREIISQAQIYLGTFVQYIFHLQPQNPPQFVPDEWEIYPIVA